MKFPAFKHPRTGKPDAILTLTCFAVIICVVKFLFEGVELAVHGHVLSLGHADAASYMAILTPVMGAHGVREFRNMPNPEQEPTRPDNPDL